jgi:hypothetical protein
VADSSPTQSHSISIISIADDQSRLKLAAALAKMSKGVSQEQIHERLQRLPWVVTKGAGANRTAQLVSLLERLGATVEVDPPLDTPEQDEPTAKDIHDMAARAPERYGAPEEIKPKGVLGGGSSSTLPPKPSSQAPPEAPDTLAPLSLSGMLDKSFDICKNHLGRLFLILAIPVVIIFAFVFLGAMIFALIGFSTDPKALFSGPTGPAIIIGLALIAIGMAIIFFVITYMSQGAVVYAVSSIYLGKPVRVMESYKFILGKIGRFILTSLLFVVVIFGSTITATIVGVAFYFLLKAIFGPGLVTILLMILIGSVLLLFPTYLALKLMLFDKAVVVEDKAYTEALKRSWNLLSGKADSQWPRGYLLRLIIILHIFLAIYLGVSMIFTPVALIIEFALPKELSIVGQVIGNIVSYAAGLIAQVYFSVCLVVFYYDIRNRKEGFDLEVMAGIK